MLAVGMAERAPECGVKVPHGYLNVSVGVMMVLERLL